MLLLYLFNKLYSFFLFVIILATGIYFTFEGGIRKKYLKKIVKKGVLSEFEKIGFKRKKKFVNGTYKNYFIELHPVWIDFFSYKIIRIEISFLPVDFEKEQLTENNRKRTRKYNKRYRWFLNEMNYLMEYWYEPKFDKIIEEIENMICVLEDENLLPITEKQSFKLMEHYEFWQDKFD